MEIRKIDTVNVQLVTGNFATCKHYHLKLSTRKKQLATGNFIFNLQNRFTARKVTLQLVKSNSQLVNLFS